jgi:uncharacterized protein (TIGR02145 family)
MTRNLNVTTFRNGEPIPQAKNEEEWRKASRNKTPAWCYANYDAGQAEAYGRLYNWYAVGDPRGLAPEGWRVPSQEDLRELADTLEPFPGRKLKSTQGWGRYGGGTNESGFTALPGGGATSGGGFIFQGTHGFWWTTSVDQNDMAYTLFLVDRGDVASGTNYAKDQGQSVRCLKD